MLGLMLVMFFVIYIWMSVLVTRATVNWAKANKRRSWFWGGLMVFFMYNLVFWDLIPTIIIHKHYCNTEAGFWVYKTPEQWVKENPELTKDDMKSHGKKMYLGSHASGWIWSFPYLPIDGKSNQYAYMINKRLYVSSDYESISSIVPVSKYTSLIVDTKNNKKLAQQITFESGYGNPMTTGGILGFKSWLARGSCSGGNASVEADKTGYKNYITRIVNLGIKS